MADVFFEVSRRFEQAPRAVWDELIDWAGHAAWIPATTVDLGDGDPTEVGYTFTAWSGFRPVALEDRMRVAQCDWDDASRRGECWVDKLGPILGGRAGFTVRPDGDGAVLDWTEDVNVKRLPRVLAPVAALAGRIGFTLAFRSLAKHLARSTPGTVARPAR